MRYLGGKASEGKAIAKLCESKLGDSGVFVDMFCGSLNVVRHISKNHNRLAVDACGPLIHMWKAALAGWVPPKTVSKELYEKIKKEQNPHDPMTAFVLFGCSFGGKWCGGYAKDRPQQRYAECAANGIVKKAKDCEGVRLEHATFQSKHPGCYAQGTVLYCDPPYENTTGYRALEPFNSGAFWFWAEQHAKKGVHVFVSEGISTRREGWELVLETTATQGGRLNPKKQPRRDVLLYKRPVPI